MTRFLGEAPMYKAIRAVLPLLLAAAACGDEDGRRAVNGEPAGERPELTAPDFRPAHPGPDPVDPGDPGDNPSEPQPEPDPPLQDGPCLAFAEGDILDFGARLVDQPHLQEVTLTNCSRDWTFERGRLVVEAHPELGGADRFVVDPRNLDGTMTIEPGGSDYLLLSYNPIAYTPETHPDCDQPSCFIPDGALLAAYAGDGVLLELELLGIATDNVCPDAVALLRPADTDIEFSENLIALPQAVIQLHGGESSDPDGTVVGYHWEVASAPVESVSVLQPNADVMSPSFEANVSGEYVFTLEVVDDRGLPSCSTGGRASAALRVVPSEGIHVELSWQTPGDQNESDSGAGRGSDVDLHFIHPNADNTWNRAPWDAHWQNKVPNWATTSRTDDPSLDRDDTDGGGPENLNLYAPEGTQEHPVRYGVGVFYFSDHGYGPTNATVRIFIDGIEVFARTLPGLSNRQFWDVATIEWPTREITAVHRVYPMNNLPSFFSSSF